MLRTAQVTYLESRELAVIVDVMRTVLRQRLRASPAGGDPVTMLLQEMVVSISATLTRPAPPLFVLRAVRGAHARRIAARMIAPPLAPGP